MSTNENGRNGENGGGTLSLLYSKAFPNNSKSPAWIGGPGTYLPAFVESLLSWSLAIGCLSVSGYHFLVSVVWAPLAAQMNKTTKVSADISVESVWDCWLPLTTASRREMSDFTPRERLGQLMTALSKECESPVDSLSNAVVIEAIRGSEILRRLTTLAMRPVKEEEQRSDKHPFAQRLVHMWPRLLQLPAEDETIPNCAMLGSSTAPKGSVPNSHDISLVVPAYREDGRQLLQKLQRARAKCRDPSQIQLVLVDAGHCRDLPTAEEIGSSWGEVRISKFTAGGGRGPCLNFGASESTGRILTFCHSDTELPDGWDETIKNGLLLRKEDHIIRPTSCAFSFGINTDPSGLNGGPKPPGIKAVEKTANWRTHMYSLPYGDQCLSVPRNVYHYLGGVPDQCLMEDYELIALLRKRTALMSKFGSAVRERLTILPGPPALCSPRRWQRFGVLYVTWTNSKCVNLYAGGMTPDDLFRLYYGAPPPERQHTNRSPWEVDLFEMEKTESKKNA